MLKNRLAPALLLVLVCAWPPAARAASASDRFADSPYIVHKWGTKDGLPQSSVFSITQSRDGYLWLGTFGGLARFDGIHFTVFGEANMPGLNSSRIVDVFADSRTNLWVGTQADGIVLIRSDGQVTNVDLGRRVQDSRLVSAFEDPSGAVWLNMAEGELARWRSNTVDVVNVRSRPVIVDKSGTIWLAAGTNLYGILTVSNSSAFVVKDILPVKNLAFLLASRDGGYWRLADGRVEKWNGDVRERDLGSYPWGTAPVTCACEDLEGNLIVGTSGAGVFWYDSDGESHNISSKQGLSHNTVLSVCMDPEGDLWVGTDGGGLNRVKRKPFRTLRGSAGLTIQSVCGDGHGGLWFSNPGWKLLYSKAQELEQFGADQGLLDTNVRSVFADKKTNVWAGTTFAGLFTLQNGRFQWIPRSEALGPISVLFEDHQGALWVGGERGLARWETNTWTLFTTTEGLSANSVTAISEDSSGNLWVGTARDGLNRFRDGTFTAFRKNAGGLPSDKITALCTDTNGVLWVGTSAGLARFGDNRWTRYTTRDGLASDGIGYLTEDGLGNLWIGSFVGLMRVTTKSLNDFASGTSATLDCRLYTQADGLPTSECTSGSQPETWREDGRLWFATVQGLVTVNPSDLKPNPFRPPVLIESVLLNGKEQQTNEWSASHITSVIVPPGRKQLEIRYTALNLAAADRSRFRYRLNNDAAWTDAGDTRVASFTDLRPGEYHFHVIACNEDGVWNETGATLAITVQPPFWRTWSFLIVSTICLLGAVAGAVYFVSTQKLQRELAVMRQKEALEKERSRIARDLHDQLGANLTQVALLGELAESDKNAPQEVESHAQQISQTARETTRALDEIVWAVNPSNDTLDGLISYVCRYAQEYFETAGLKYRLDAPSALPDGTIAPEVRHNVFLAAKEAINNVVKHAHATTAWLRLEVNSDRFTIRIEDDGRGFAAVKEKPERNGLRNMRRRMEDVGGSFEIGPAAGQGTVVQLTVPIKKS